MDSFFFIRTFPLRMYLSQVKLKSLEFRVGGDASLLVVLLGTNAHICMYVCTFHQPDK
jgi:hypothetical protein